MSFPTGVDPYPKQHRSNPRSLMDWRWCSWDAFVEVGGTDDMHAASLFKTEAQAFYSGQVTAFDKVLSLLDRVGPDA